MHLFAGPFAAFAVLLAMAGGAKALKPLSTVRALRSVSLPASSSLVRSLGAGEALLAVVSLLVGGPLPAALVALSYAGFAGFVVHAMSRGGTISSCGCFGKADSPPTVSHVIVNSVAAGIAGAAAIWPAGSPLRELADSPAAGVALTLLVVVTTGLAYLVLAEWPRLVGVLREGPQQDGARA